MVEYLESEEDFEAAVAAAAEAKKLLCVQFTATWCGPCKLIAPAVTALSTEVGDDCIFYKVDSDELDEIAGQYDVASLPTFLYFWNKEKVDSIFTSKKDALQDSVKKMIAKAKAGEL